MKTRKPGIVVATVALIAFGVEAQCGEAPGFERVTLDMPHRETVVRGAIWYPAGTGGEVRQVGENAVFIGVPVRDGAAVAEGRHPVILLSHGLGGRIETNAWLSAGLAARGAIVLSVNHPKSTSSDFDLRQAWNHWTRAQDLQGALDWLLDEPHWMPRVDGTRIAAVGYSYGGWTVLSHGRCNGQSGGLCRVLRFVRRTRRRLPPGRSGRHRPRRDGRRPLQCFLEGRAYQGDRGDRSGASPWAGREQP